jgi:hypothetical protein
MSRRRVDLFSIVNLFNEPRIAPRRLLLLARNGHGGAVTACLLSGAKRKTSTRDEYFAL